jgi:hypothetical protein
MEGRVVRPLADSDFDYNRPLQTKRGAKQALRCGHNKVDELIRSGALKTVDIGDRITRITTESILEVATGQAAGPDAEEVAKAPKPKN